MVSGYGEFIKKHRLLSGYKQQKDLAEVSKVARSTISRIENEIQRPTVETLKELAPHLTSTDLVDLIAICGYWNENEFTQLPGRVNRIEQCEEAQAEYLTSGFDTSPNSIKLKTPSNEEAFVHNIDLADSDIFKKFNLELDGRALTEEEAKTIISYVRFLRSQN